MSTFTRAVAASSDDAAEAAGGSPSIVVPIFAMAANLAWGGMRFTDLNIPVGATITSATIAMVLTDSSKNDAQGTWFGNDVDDAATFTTANGNVDGRTLTSASVAWTTNDLGTVGQTVSSPNLATILQEIVDRPGWESGNAAVFLYRHESGAEFLQWASWDHATSAEPVLTVTFTTDDYGALDPIVEAYLGGTWVDISDSVPPQALTIKRGRPNEASQVQPSSVTFDLDNRDGAFTPDNPMSPYFGQLDRGTEVRVRLPGGATDTYLVLDGTTNAYASTPDAASLDITGDITLVFDGDIAWTRYNQQTSLVGKLKAESDERSYLMYLFADGTLSMLWTSDGTYNTGGWAITTDPLPFVSGRHAVAATLDVNNGAGAWTVHFYTAPTGAGPFTLLESTSFDQNTLAPAAAPTSVYASTAPLEVGPVTGELSAPPTGKVYRAGVLSGTFFGGTEVANPNFGAQAAGTTSFADTATPAKTWTLQGDAYISDVDDNRVRFHGQIDELLPDWPQGDISDPADPEADPGESFVTLNASGYKRRLGQGEKPLDSPLFRAAMRPSPQLIANAQLGYWPCEDGSDATVLASPMPGVAPMIISSTIRTAAESSNVASKPLPTAQAGEWFSWYAPIPPQEGLVVTDWVCTLMVNMATLPASETALIQIASEGTIVRWVISADATDLKLRAYDAGGTEVITTSGGFVDGTDGWTLLFLRVEQEGANIRRRSGWVTVNGSAFGGTSTIAGTVGRPTDHYGYGIAPADGLSFGHIAIAHDLQADWLGWGNTDGSAHLAYADERAGDRLQRLCGEQSIPFRIIGDARDTAAMGPQGMETLTDLLEECATVDGGILYEDRPRLGLVYRTRVDLYNQDARLPLDASTRMEGGLVVSDIVPPFKPVKDDQRLRNDVTVKRDGGAAYRATTDPEPHPRDLYDEEHTLSVASDLDLPDQAGWKLHLGTWPGMRLPGLTVDISSAPHLTDAWLESDLGDRITVANTPPQMVGQRDVDVLMEGYEETITPTMWRVAPTCSAGGPWRVGVRSDPDEPARRDSAGTVLEDDMTETGTDLLFLVTKGHGWTEEAGDYPFDIVVAGERMTAENITDLGGGVFDFEVIRSVNGVVKAHVAGEEVHLWRPAYRAL